MNREIEDGMGFAGLVGETAEEREIERLQRRVSNLEREVLALVNQLRMPSTGNQLSMDARCQLIAVEALLKTPQTQARRRGL